MIWYKVWYDLVAVSMFASMLAKLTLGEKKQIVCVAVLLLFCGHLWTCCDTRICMDLPDLPVFLMAIDFKARP